MVELCHVRLFSYFLGYNVRSQLTYDMVDKNLIILPVLFYTEMQNMFIIFDSKFL